MTSHRDIREFVEEEASRWTTADDGDADAIEDVLSDALRLGPVQLSADVQNMFLTSSTCEIPSTDQMLAHLFGATMRRTRENVHLSIDQVSEEIGSDAVLLERIEAGSSNPSALPAKRLAIWAKLLELQSEVIKPSLLLALEYVGRIRAEEGAVFARRSSRSNRAEALTRTEAYEYFERLESALRDD